MDKDRKKFSNKENIKKKIYIEKLCKVELLHKKVYKILSEYEKDKEIKTLLISFSKEENNHANLYKRVLHIRDIKINQILLKLNLYFLISLKYIFGLSIFVKILEYNENNLHFKLNNTIKFLKKNGIKNLNEIKLLNKIERDERINEMQLLNKIMSYDKILNYIKDIGLSLNDGIVEILGTCVGIAAALQQPLLVAIAGIIVAVAGGLSIAGGTYISTDYEKAIDFNVFKKLKATKSPLMSGIYSGIFYIIGSVFPILPFFLGLNLVIAIILSITLSIILLVFVSILVSIITTTSILKRITKTLVISLGAVIIAIILGFYIRKFFNITL